MNTDLHPTPDEHLEARITAWVLGQASPFESAELEALCAEDPKLEEFRKRTEALHKLLLETPPSESDHFWKISQQRRSRLDPIIGSTTHFQSREKYIRRAAIRTAFGIAAVFAFTLFIKRFIFTHPQLELEAGKAMETSYSSPPNIRGMIEDESTKNRIPMSFEKKADDISQAANQTGSTDQNGKEFSGTSKPTIDASELRDHRITGAGGNNKANAGRENDNKSNLPAETTGNFFGDLTNSTHDHELEGKKDNSLPQPAPKPKGHALGRDVFESKPRVAKITPERDHLSHENLGRSNNSGITEVAAAAPEVAPATPLGIASDFKADTDSLKSLAKDESSSADVDLLNAMQGDALADINGRDLPPKEPSYLPEKAKQDETNARNSNQTNDIVRQAENSKAEAEERMKAIQGFDSDINKISGVGVDLPEAIVPAPEEAIHIRESRESGSDKEVISNLTLQELDTESLAKSDSTKIGVKQLVDLSNEISAADEIFSTFSMNISDASFQLAIAAIENGQRPDPSSIKAEQFYNAIDYGDPAPSSDEPVAAAIDQTAHPVIPGRNLVRVSLRTGSTGRSAAQPLRLTLLVDQSGSMVREDRRAAMVTALNQLSTLLNKNDRITVIGFSRTPHLLADSIPGNEAGKLPEIINQTASEGGTNIEQAIHLASELALRQQLNGAQNRIVLFTDGAANLGDAKPESLSKKITELRQQGLAFDIAGIGTNEINDRLLSDLARHGNGRYYLVGDNSGANFASQLAGAFRPAAENVKVQVKLNPQRVGNYKLIGFENDRLKTEDFHNDAVDAAELAADEAGVALYQVETLPQGTGEIGEVSVRFRDTASDEMVERKWTIPYDATTPSFDKANPKTQLATLAVLAAQKLQGGAMADAIDFSKFSKTIAELKQTHAQSARTQQLIQLINRLK